MVIHHYGFLRSDRAKSNLYGGLAQRHARDRPDDPRALVDWGIALLAEARFPAAADAFRRAFALEQDGAGAFLLGSMLHELDDPARAIPLLHEASRRNHDDESPYYDRADAREELALALEALDRRHDAERAYREALSLRPDSPAAISNLAALLIERRDEAEAERLLGPLLDSHRGSPVPWSLLGVLRLRQGDLEGARKALETALDISPDKLVPLLNLALTRTRAGRPRKAARAYAAAAERLGSDQARLLDLERRVPRRYRRGSRRRLSLERNPVVSLVDTLAGGGGRMVVDGVLALRGRAQLVVCFDARTGTRQGLREEVEAAGVDVVTVSSESTLRIVLEQVRPAVVLHHWTQGQHLATALRVAAERWVCVGHAGVSLPYGYDSYAVDSDFQEQLQTHLPPERVFRVPHGVDRSRFELPERRGSGPVTIAMVSRLQAGKFPRRLLDFLPSLEGVRVLIAGFGRRRWELEPDVAARGLADRVHFVGPLASGEIPPFLSAADIGLHLTETDVELSALAVLEMLAAGLPVVTQPRGALPELIVPGENGFLASEEAEVAARLHELVRSHELRRRLGEGARETARRFDMAQFRASLRELVTEVERRPAASPFSGRRSAPRDGRRV